MTIEEQVKVLCVRSGISVSELARRLGTSPQNFNGKLHRRGMRNSSSPGYEITHYLSWS